MRKFVRMLILCLILFSSTAIDSPSSKDCFSQLGVNAYFESTPKMVEAIIKLDALEMRIDALEKREKVNSVKVLRLIPKGKTVE